MAAFASTVLATVGLAWLALSLRRHAPLVGALVPSRAQRLRWAGVAMTIAAPLPWALSTDYAQALVTWCLCLLPIAGLLVALALAFQPEVLVFVTAARQLADRRPRNARK